MFNDVTFEISGKCNANCQYCISGKNSISGDFQKKNSSYIEPEKFEAAINYLLEHDMINMDSVIGLFNWGEPLLHPQFKEIVSILNRKKLHYTLSTNGSKLIEFDNFDLSYLDRIIFSMPGFSQKSYDLVHGFRFERIKTNIEKILTNYRANGFVGSAALSFHMYKFNTDELPLAMEFVKELEHLGLTVNASGAYLNGYSMSKDFLAGNYNEEKVAVIESQLYTSYYKQFQAQRPKEYVCPQFSRLVIDESCNIVSCCGVDKTYYSQALVGNLFDLALDELKQKKTNALICSECQSLGIDYIGHNPVMTSYQLDPDNHKVVLMNEGTEVSEGKVFLYGSGDIADSFIYQNQNSSSSRFDIVGVMDGNPSKEGAIYNSFMITMPENAKLTDKDMILIASQDESSIQAMTKSLTTELKIKNKVLRIVER
jgi:MoaA/NifB/PqqE/SkfB family radical SAM enzyme